MKDSGEAERNGKRSRRGEEFEKTEFEEGLFVVDRTNERRLERRERRESHIESSSSRFIFNNKMNPSFVAK